MISHEVEGLANGDGSNALGADQLADRLQVCVGAQYPDEFGVELLLRDSSCHRQHVGLGVDGEHDPHSTGEGLGKQTGATPEVDHYVARVEAQKIGDGIDGGVGVAPSISRVELGRLASERTHAD